MPFFLLVESESFSTGYTTIAQVVTVFHGPDKATWCKVTEKVLIKVNHSQRCGMVVSWCGLPIWQNWEFEVLFSFLLAEESNKSCLGPFPTGTSYQMMA